MSCAIITATLSPASFTHFATNMTHPHLAITKEFCLASN